jgi:hypothetical protein
VTDTSLFPNVFVDAAKVPVAPIVGDAYNAMILTASVPDSNRWTAMATEQQQRA